MQILKAMKNKPAKPLPLAGCRANGYVKAYDRMHNKVYRAMLDLGGEGRLVRRHVRTATGALEYGKQVAERYRLLFPVVEQA